MKPQAAPPPQQLKPSEPLSPPTTLRVQDAAEVQARPSAKAAQKGLPARRHIIMVQPPMAPPRTEQVLQPSFQEVQSRGGWACSCCCAEAAATTVVAIVAIFIIVDVVADAMSALLSMVLVVVVALLLFGVLWWAAGAPPRRRRHFARRPPLQFLNFAGTAEIADTMDGARSGKFLLINLSTHRKTFFHFLW